MDARTKDWIKCKNLLDDDYIVCGYIEKDGGIVSIILGKYTGKSILYKGHVTLGLSREDWKSICSLPKKKNHPFESLPRGNEQAIWVSPHLVCTVQYMEISDSGVMRQPVFKGLRSDKKPQETV
jgi:bifunctional non-homologous end joining protein LigD/DNA ligase-1